ncbi:MAG: ATP-binding protein [Deltaproteobacteria bacterium]|nr:ATP-binding protein [Deltaproteobacteria bacterium]
MRIVLTGGPSAGKTTLLELLHRQYADAVGVAPEAASILFRGGFPRPQTSDDRAHTQRSIYALQKELEASALERSRGDVVFCDRGSLDGASYWSGSVHEFARAMDTTVERELSRYAMVVHLETAPEAMGYTLNDVRTETHAEASALDRRIGEIWSLHPNYHFVSNATAEGRPRGFVEKLNSALLALRPHLPTDALVPRLRYATAGDLLQAAP